MAGSPQSRTTVALLLSLLSLPAPPASAFHGGGVGSCSGCHAMHDPDAAGPALLRAASPTDVCLTCHDTDNGNTWGADPLNPGPVYGGGPFVFLSEDNLNDGPGGGDPTNFIGGHQGGHNVISIARGSGADPEFPVAPGGSYRSSNLHCTSCHDPHGRGGHFRLLYGSDHPEARINGEVFLYTRPAPDAVGIALDGPAESDANHTAYRSGMSEWCANCHGDYHDSGGSGFSHPGTHRLDGNERDVYNRYRGSDRFDGDGTDAYIVHVPIEFPGATTTFRGPAPLESRLTCLSCHRAHASSGPRSGRWDFNIGTWAEEGVVSGSWRIPNPYQDTVGDAQRRLCEKCHGNDVPN